jgi:hypothetical protein
MASAGIYGPDRDRLCVFIDDVVYVLDETVKAQNILFPDSFRANLNDAWGNVSSRIDQIKNDIRNTNTTTDRQLEAAGLTGAQLNLKLDGFGAAFGNWKVKAGLKLLRRVLSWANVILGSLSFVAEVLKEIKEAIEKALEEVE